MTVNSSANSVILILFAFSDNLSAENSKSSADFCIQRIQLLECMAQGVAYSGRLTHADKQFQIILKVFRKYWSHVVRNTVRSFVEIQLTMNEKYTDFCDEDGVDEEEQQILEVGYFMEYNFRLYIYLLATSSSWIVGFVVWKFNTRKYHPRVD